MKSLKKHKIRRDKKSGIALISVLIVIAILAPLSIKLFSDYQQLFQKVITGESYDSALMYALFAEDLAKYVLNKDVKNNKYDGVNDEWANPIAAIPIDGGIISGKIQDLQGKLNINNLFQKEGEKAHTVQINNVSKTIQFHKKFELFQKEGEKAHTVQINNVSKTIQFHKKFENAFKKLLIKLDVPEYEAEKILNSTLDWIDKDTNARNGGAEDIYYQSLSKPYRTANNLIVDISELKLIKGVSPEIFDKINGCLTALPNTETKVNVNMANDAVLSVLSEVVVEQVNNIGVTTFTGFHKNNDTNKISCDDSYDGTYKKIDDFIAKNKLSTESAEGTPTAVIKEFMSTTSDYFTVNTVATFNENTINLQTFLHRTKEKNKNIVKVLFRNFSDIIISNQPSKTTTEP